MFTETGTPLIELCREGEVSIIDISFLEEKVSSLVIGILARKILNARKLSARKTSMKKFAVEMEDMLETGIPPTWLFIDEAHTLIPSGAKTPASDPLIEYVKQGRRPGCSLVFATQQPSAIDTKVLSQLDILLCHKLVFDDDLKAVLKRMPTMIPKEYQHSKFIRSLPIGHCLVGDRSDSTSRAFVMKVRPRFSQHEGREARSVSFEEGIKPEEVKDFLIKTLIKRIGDFKRVHLRQVDQLVRTINKRYKTKIESKDLVQELTAGDYKLDGDYLVPKSYEPSPEGTDVEEVLVLKGKIDEDKARVILESKRRKKLFGLVGNEENLKEFGVRYSPIYKLEYDYFEKGGFRRSVCYIDGITGEIIGIKNGNLTTTKGVKKLLEMPPEKRKVIVALRKGKKASVKSLSKFSGLSEADTMKESDELVDEGKLKKDKKGVYSLKYDFNLPEKLVTPEFTSLETELVMEKSTGITEKPTIPDSSVSDIPALFGEVKIRDKSFIYKPVYYAIFSSKSGNRELVLDSMTGKVIEKD